MNAHERTTGERTDLSRTEPARAHLSRLQLLTDVVVFQAKLLIDGLRDVLLSPLSIVAAVVGLLTGGDEPQRYFQKVIRFGRRTEVWINLFGEHDGPGTSDHLVDPLRSKVIDQAQANPWISRAGTHLNRQLDEVNSAVTRGSEQDPAPPSPPRDPG
jgi:hypothetical protein